MRNLYLLFLIIPLQLTAQNTGKSLPTALPESRGYAAGFLKTIAVEASKQVPNLDAFLIWQKDALIYEKYFHNFNRDSTFNIKSASKSVLSAIAGVAMAQGYLKTLDTKVLDALPNYNLNRHTPGTWFAEDMKRDDSILQTLTLRNLITMQTGLEWNDFGPICQAFVNSSDPVRFTLDLPFSEEYAPGKKFNYCSGGAHTFGVALARHIPFDLWKFADSFLFAPAGMKLQRWNTDAMGRYIGGCDMYFTAHDMMRFGILYLKKGKINGLQIISENWVKESTAKQAQLNYWDVLPGANGYGYFWWRRQSNKHQVYVASGVCGQLICIVPDLELVIVTACSCGEENGRAEIRKLHLLMDKIIAATKK